jgi:hypothetical protein
LGQGARYHNAYDGKGIGRKGSQSRSCTRSIIPFFECKFDSLHRRRHAHPSLGDACFYFPGFFFVRYRGGEINRDRWGRRAVIFNEARASFDDWKWEMRERQAEDYSSDNRVKSRSVWIIARRRGYKGRFRETGKLTPTIQRLEMTHITRLLFGCFSGCFSSFVRGCNPHPPTYYFKKKTNIISLFYYMYECAPPTHPTRIISIKFSTFLLQVLPEVVATFKLEMRNGFYL